MGLGQTIMKSFSLKILAYVVIALFIGSAYGIVHPAFASSSPSSTVIPSGSISDHGPLINDLVLEYESDSSSFLSVQSGTVPAMEWSLSLANYATAESNNKLYANSTLSYDFDGIAFNFLQYPYNNTYFRQAMADLMDYATIQNQLGPTIQAGNNIYNPNLFPLYNTGVVTDPYSYNATAAFALMQKVPGMTYSNSTGWMLNGAPFSPQIYSRGDDPVIREPIAQLLGTDMKNDINMTLNNQQITDEDAGADVYGPAGAATISQGVMGSNYQTVQPPVVNWTYVDSGGDSWGMYTFGWIVSFNPTYTWAFFNSALFGIDDFGDYYNSSMDYATNILDYANSSTVAQNAAESLQQIYYQQLPYIVFGWQNTLFAVNPSSGSGWTGFTNLPTLGPSESTGLFYTALNVHPASSATGGTYVETLHSAASSLDPLYATNWIWDVDAWQFIYDSPLGTVPTNAGVLNGELEPWMGTVSTSNNNNTAIGSGPGWYSPFGAKNLVNGQVFTINFYANDTWDDGVPLTAQDYNESLYIENVMGNSPTDTPFAYDLAPPLGIVATYIPPTDPMQIQIFVNSTTVWNIYSINIPVLPWHIFQYFNASDIATSTPSAIDLTVPFDTTDKGDLNSQYTSAIPQFLQWLPNLEVGSSAFDFQTWNTVTNVINMTRNPMWQRSDWQAFSSTVTPGSPYSFSTTLTQEIYNPTTSTFDGVAAGATGNIPVTNATGNVIVMNANGGTVESVALAAGTNGAYTASIPTTSLTSGASYELMTNLTYTLFGLQRVSHQYTGLTIGVSTTSTSTSTSSTTSTSTTTTTTAPPSVSTTEIAAIVVVVAVVVVAAAVLFLRRRPAAPAAPPAPSTT